MGSLSFMQDGGEIGTEEIVVTGKRTGKSVNNPTSVLHPNYNTWQAGMSSYIPEEIVEGDYLNARLGGGKNVFGQYKGNKTNKKSTAAAPKLASVIINSLASFHSVPSPAEANFAAMI